MITTISGYAFGCSRGGRPRDANVAGPSIEADAPEGEATVPSVQTPVDFLGVFFAEAADEQLNKVHESGHQRRSGSSKRSEV